MAAETHAVSRAFGWLLVTLGGLWTVLAGGCTLLFVGGSIWSMVTSSGSDATGILIPALVIGAIGIVPGALILWGGLALLRKSRRPVAP